MELLDAYNTVSSDVRIKDYDKSCRDGGKKYPDWQRFDGWTPQYKREFVKAVLEGKDIPKIYTYEDPEDTEDTEDTVEYILDGGHRSRAISEYIDGEFAISLKGDWYSFKVLEDGREPKKRKNATSKSLLLPEDLKKRLLRTQLQVVCYSDIDENMARQIFNELNHQRPMTICENVNSHQSLLVDNIRLIAFQENSPVDSLVGFVPKFKKPNHEFYKFMVALFSIFERTGDDRFRFCEPSSLIRYVRGDGNPDEKGKPTNNAQFTHDEMTPLFANFLDILSVYIAVLGNLPAINETGDAYSIFLYINQNRGKSVDLLSNALKEFMDRVILYKSVSKCIEKTMNHPGITPEAICVAKTELDEMRKNSGEHVVEWTSTTQNNPCGPSNMRTRSRILGEHLHIE